ncbi:MAG: ROK family protein [Calditrichaeota bacterium]|nr:ROK family protein [Calditrichota bacterium]
MSDRSGLIGLDLGGTNIKYGVCLPDGTIIDEFIRQTNKDAPAEVILNDLESAARQALDVARQKGIAIQTIGVGTPGSVDVGRGYLKGSTPNFKSWKDVPIKEILERTLQLPVYVDNDANVMAFGEYRFGAGRGYQTIISITLGTGIGGGIILNGKLFRGHNFAGGELGHMSISYRGRKCRCGGTGCWELYASATSMLENFRRWSKGREASSTREIVDLYEQGDPVARRVIETEVAMVAVGVASIINIFNPEIFIIGGGVSEAGDWFIDMIRQRVQQSAMEQSLLGVKIVRAELGNKAGWLGAAAFAREEWLNHLNAENTRLLT